jgi:hypothetical protein
MDQSGEKAFGRFGLTTALRILLSSSLEILENSHTGNNSTGRVITFLRKVV